MGEEREENWGKNSRKGKNGDSESNKKKGEKHKEGETKYEWEKSEKVGRQGSKNSYRMKWREERENLCNQIKEDINSSILESESMEEFYDTMKRKGNQMHIRAFKRSWRVYFI